MPLLTSTKPIFSNYLSLVCLKKNIVRFSYSCCHLQSCLTAKMSQMLVRCGNVTLFSQSKPTEGTVDVCWRNIPLNSVGTSSATMGYVLSSSSPCFVHLYVICSSLASHASCCAWSPPGPCRWAHLAGAELVLHHDARLALQLSHQLLGGTHGPASQIGFLSYCVASLPHIFQISIVLKF